MRKGKDGFYCRYVKGTFARVLAISGLLLFWWLYVIIAVLVKIDDPKGPVIFKQQRIGQNGKVYWMYKFRSMRVGAEKMGSGVYSDNTDPRVTRIGRVLRKTSLEGNAIIRQTTKSHENKGIFAVSPIHFLRGCNLNFYNLDTSAA